jgi:prepilin-type N-terminal cleavage/methylation domain-containing protein
MRSLRRLRDPSGFTLVEVMVAILLLSIGVLATVSLADNANRSTNTTKAREGATNVARDVLEGVHAIPWSSLTQALAPGKVQAISGLGDADASKAGWQIIRRNTTYNVTLTVCSVDDPADGFAASHDSSFCALAGATTKPTDTNGVDYRRATVNLTWSDQQGTRSLTQATTVTNIDNGPVPRITADTLSGPPFVMTSTAGTSLGFTVTTDQPAGNVDWLLGGIKQGAATGSGTTWNFTWPIGAATGGTNNGTTGCNPSGSGTLDGTYFLGAQAFSPSNVSPGPQAATVVLNRCSPLAPTNFKAGKTTALSGKIEVNWDDNTEDDISGYRVYRSATSGGPFTQVASGGCSGLLTTTDCVDDDPLAVPAVTWYYKGYAVDRDSGGALREGDAASITYSPSNRAPTVPSIASGGASSTLTWPRSTDPDAGDSVDFYWIYRDGQTFAKRWDAADGGPTTVTWNDPDPSGGPHDYWVTAVDNHGAESNYSSKVTR